MHIVQERRRGSEHHWAKLDEAKVREIKQAHARGERIVDLGRRFGVSPQTIRKAIRGLNWSHVE